MQMNDWARARWAQLRSGQPLKVPAKQRLLLTPERAPKPTAPSGSAADEEQIPSTEPKRLSARQADTTVEWVKSRSAAAPRLLSATGRLGHIDAP
jgi:hypothetical protein